MNLQNNGVYFVDGVRTFFGKARPTGMFAQTRADDLVVKLIMELRRRNPKVDFTRLDDNVWGATKQIGDQGITMGRNTVLTAGLPVTVPGMSVDRMCAGGMTAVTIGGSAIAFGSADIVIVGGVEHMGHHPMDQDIDPNPRLIAERIVSPTALNMGNTAENLHDWLSANGHRLVSKEQSDEYAVQTTLKYFEALDNGYYADHTVPMAVFTPNGWIVADHDEQPRRDITLEGMRHLRTPFKANGRVTPGNASGLNDGAAGCLLMSGKACKEFGVSPKMRLVGFAFAGVDPGIMGWGPVPATEKVLARTNLKFKDLDIIELNEAFAVQAIAFADYFGMDPNDMNPYGGAIAIGHPLASSGPRLVIQMAKDFELHDVQYGLTTMCVGLGQGGSLVWEKVLNN